MASNCENFPNAAPTVSIIVPVYNAAKYLRNCLESCRMQVLGDFEVLCVDDGSTDASPALLAEFAARDNRFRVFHQRNLGAGPARNMALDEARGQYVCFLDADDRMERDALSVTPITDHYITRADNHTKVFF